MESSGKTSAGTVQPSHAEGGNPPPDMLAVSNTMLLLTWIAFIIMLIVLYKIAWKPIFAALDKREADIRGAVENAARIREELSGIEKTRAEIISSAGKQAREINESARKDAALLALTMEKKARDEARAVEEGAEREIKAARESALSSMKKEVAGMAVVIAYKTMREDMDEARKLALAEKITREI